MCSLCDGHFSHSAFFVLDHAELTVSSSRFTSRWTGLVWAGGFLDWGCPHNSPRTQIRNNSASEMVAMLVSSPDFNNIYKVPISSGRLAEPVREERKACVLGTMETGTIPALFLCLFFLESHRSSQSLRPRRRLAVP